LESIYRFSGFSQDEFEVIVADDDSEDGTIHRIKEAMEYFANLKYFKNSKNLGFSATCNNGASHASGKFLIFLNNDTMVTRGWDRALYDTIRKDHDIWIVGARCIYPDGTLQHAGVPFPEFFDQSLGHIYKGMPAFLPLAGYEKDFQCVTGACMIIRKSDFKELKGFDLSYYNGFEDVDLCLRIREKGKRIVYQPQCMIIHYESKSDGRFDAMDSNKIKLLSCWSDKIIPDEIEHFRNDIEHSVLTNQLVPLKDFRLLGWLDELKIYGEHRILPDGDLELIPSSHAFRFAFPLPEGLAGEHLLVAGELDSASAGILRLNYLTNLELFYSDQRCLSKRIFQGSNFFTFSIDSRYLTGELILTLTGLKSISKLKEFNVYTFHPEYEAITSSFVILCHIHYRTHYLQELLEILKQVPYREVIFELLVTYDRISLVKIQDKDLPNISISYQKRSYSELPVLYNEYLAKPGHNYAVSISDGVVMTAERFARFIEILHTNPEIGVIFGDTKGWLAYEDNLPYQKTIFQKTSLRQMKDTPVAFRIAAWELAGRFNTDFSYYFNLDLATKIVSSGTWKGYQMEGIRARSFIEQSEYPPELKPHLEDFRELYYAQHSKYHMLKWQMVAKEREKLLEKYLMSRVRQARKGPHATLIGSITVHLRHFMRRLGVMK
jgi:glycosyltransferase involved in cell wall biosynthesis